ncbi:MAG: hypothetical protein AAGM22_00505, partial [Acidobacteriota bacterium]
MKHKTFNCIGYLLVLLLATVFPLAAQANDDLAKACYPLNSDLDDGFAINTDQTVYYFFTVGARTGCYQNVFLSLSLEMDTPHLEGNVFAGGNKNVAIYAAPGA